MEVRLSQIVICQISSGIVRQNIGLKMKQEIIRTLVCYLSHERSSICREVHDMKLFRTS
jgi:hypothetical protein